MTYYVLPAEDQEARALREVFGSEVASALFWDAEEGEGLFDLVEAFNTKEERIGSCSRRASDDAARWAKLAEIPAWRGMTVKFAIEVRQGSGTVKTINDYADEIMTMVLEDMDNDDAMRRRARSFGDLHDYTDANEYMIHADVPFNPDDPKVMDFYVAVQDEVTRRLKEHPVLVRAVTFVTTLGIADEQAQGAFENDLRLLIAKHHLSLLSCGWAPDPESILDQTPDADHVVVVDMNPHYVR